MRLTFTETIELKPRYIRVLKMLGKRRIGWNFGIRGRILDDLDAWGLTTQCSVGSELYEITAKGQQALRMIES